MNIVNNKSLTQKKMFLFTTLRYKTEPFTKKIHNFIGYQMAKSKTFNSIFLPKDLDTWSELSLYTRNNPPSIQKHQNDIIEAHK